SLLHSIASGKICLCFCTGHGSLLFQERVKSGPVLLNLPTFLCEVWSLKWLKRQFLDEAMQCAKGIVALTIGVPRQGRAPCLPRDLAAPNQQCEATGKKDATLWRLTSPGTPAILRGVGRSPGDCVALEAGPRCLGGLGHGERLQTLPVTSPL